MRDTRIIMGMPVTVEAVDASARSTDLEEIFDYFITIDARFSTYKTDSEISQINAGRIGASEYSAEMREVFVLAEETKRATHGFFDIKRPDGLIDPSGIVKGWAIKNAVHMLSRRGLKNFYVEAGGDIQSSGTNAEGAPWSVGIRSPFQLQEIVKVLYPRGAGVATSGTYIRGQHIYNPHAPNEKLDAVLSLTVIGPDILEADRYATAAFAMEESGIAYIEHLSGFEAYEIDAQGMARLTSGFSQYTTP